MLTQSTPLESSPSFIAATPRLHVGCYRFLFEHDPQCELVGYSGSAWRGAFGHALKRLVCVTRERHCPNCLLYHGCIYPYIFETPPPPSTAKMRRYNAAPHPFVLEPPDMDGAHGKQTLHPLGLTLFGQANRYLPYLVHALQRAGEYGLGARRLPLYLVDIQQAAPVNGSCWQSILIPDGFLEPRPPEVPAAPPLPASLLIAIRTPLRVTREGRLVGPQEFRFADLFAGLLRRVSLLTYFHTETPLETDFKGLTALAREVPLRQANLCWHDWTRYSSRQNTKMQMGGLVGEFGLDAAGLEPLWPYLWLGQWTHAGKNTSMGLGRYEIRGMTSLPENTNG